MPNRAARDYLGLVGRATRFQQTDGPYAVAPAIPALGKWLTFLADRSDHPGSALLADLTGMPEHWATGRARWRTPAWPPSSPGSTRRPA